MHNEDLRKIVGDVVRDTVRAEMGPLDGRVTALEGLMGQHAQTLTTCANAAAKALETALEAKRAVDEAKDATAKMIAAAMDQQKGAIATTVGEIVRPIVQKVDAVDENNRTQNLTLGAQNSAMVLFARQLGVEGQLDPALRHNSLPPASGEPAPPTHPVLPTIDRRSRIITIIVSLALIAQAAREIAGLFSHH